MTITLKGQLDSKTTGKIWRDNLSILDKKRPNNLIVDASGLVYCDGSGTGLLVELKRRQLVQGSQFELRGLADEFNQIFNLLDTTESLSESHPSPKRALTIERIGKQLIHFINENIALVDYIGQFTLSIFWGLFNPKKLRWKDTFRTMENDWN